MPQNCSNVNIYEDLRHCAGEVNLPGVLPFFFWVRRSDITAWPTLPSKTPAQGQTAATMGTVAVYTGNFSLKADVKWNRCDMVPESATFKNESQGNWGGKTFNNQATLVVPGTKEAVTGMITEMNNDDIVILIPGRDGKCRVIGNKEFNAELALSQDQGAAAAGDSAQTTIEASCTDKVALPFYPGDIVTEDGTYNGGSCFTPES